MLFLVVLLLMYLGYKFIKSEKIQTIEVKNAFTEEQVNSDEVKAILIEENVETPIEIIDSNPTNLLPSIADVGWQTDKESNK